MALGNVPRCQHIKINGTQCGSPALHRRRRCFFHERAREQHDRIVKDQFKQARFVLPVLEDANAVQMALMQVMQLLAWGEMDRKTAGLLLYGLQTASANLRNVDFEPGEPTDVVIDREQVHRTDIGGPQWDPEDFEWDEEEDAEEEAEDSVEENDAVTPAAAQTADSPAASVNAPENGKPEPTMDEVRKEIRGLVHNYIMEAGGDGRAMSG
ncbi:MAG: hypothetical protein ACLP9L_14575 [Thermoguttaceae bacterium]